MGVKRLNKGGLSGLVSWAEIMGNMYLLQKVTNLEAWDFRARCQIWEGGILYLAFVW